MTIPIKDDPFALFDEWFQLARACREITEPTAMTLATVSPEGLPTARVVLLKGFDTNGFVFYTNLTSAKAIHLRANPHCTLCFYWMPLNRQVRIEGTADQVSDEEADAYFATRPRLSQLGAWASKQSQPLPSRHELEKRLAKYTLQFGMGSVPRPPFWSGFRVRPTAFEFWLKQPFRLHDRLRYERDGETWRPVHLYP